MNNYISLCKLSALYVDDVDTIMELSKKLSAYDASKLVLFDPFDGDEVFAEIKCVFYNKHDKYVTIVAVDAYDHTRVIQDESDLDSDMEPTLSIGVKPEDNDKIHRILEKYADKTDRILASIIEIFIRIGLMLGCVGVFTFAIYIMLQAIMMMFS